MRISQLVMVVALVGGCVPQTHSRKTIGKVGGVAVAGLGVVASLTMDTIYDCPRDDIGDFGCIADHGMKQLMGFSAIVLGTIWLAAAIASPEIPEPPDLRPVARLPEARSALHLGFD